MGRSFLSKSTKKLQHCWCTKFLSFQVERNGNATFLRLKSYSVKIYLFFGNQLFVFFLHFRRSNYRNCLQFFESIGLWLGFRAPLILKKMAVLELSTLQVWHYQKISFSMRWDEINQVTKTSVKVHDVIKRNKKGSVKPDEFIPSVIVTVKVAFEWSKIIDKIIFAYTTINVEWYIPKIRQYFNYGWLEHFTNCWR